MKEYVIGPLNEGLRLDKQLIKILNNAPAGFVYKMLRKKNITLNGKKASGSERLKSGDIIRIFLSDDTFDLMSSDRSGVIVSDTHGVDFADFIIYEDIDIIILNKPSGLLSQRASKDDISVNELGLKYLMDKGEIDKETLKVFKPSICNRLDRNTSGIMIFAKTYICANAVSAMLKDHSLKKHYKCFVSGKVNERVTLDGFLIKDERTNRVSVLNRSVPGSSRIVTSYEPAKSYDDHTLIDVELITGKTHQIRAHLASVKHPILGDAKYGDRGLNDILRSKYGITSQMLHAGSLTMPCDMPKGLKHLEARTFLAPLPDEFNKMEVSVI
ncbi:MAG: RluA family pseudouridine synthase [Lachnospiraceae bacterium]|nr:RluA family pseudouridine synthase [Lachnospiraceae bacterium]